MLFFVRINLTTPLRPTPEPNRYFYPKRSSLQTSSLIFRLITFKTTNFTKESKQNDCLIRKKKNSGNLPSFLWKYFLILIFVSAVRVRDGLPRLDVSAIDNCRSPTNVGSRRSTSIRVRSRVRVNSYRTERAESKDYNPQFSLLSIT